ncbi:glycosyltransferase [Halalkalicoccus tibetensis]|uniref:Glycosyltransferase n=1 Tax=Halalkalicoccus tibetensis TaxID=175632 RepID=A0ABD5V6P7_9EURY
MRKNVLIITRYFPPGGGIGAFRAAKFVKYLPNYGWDPYVISLPQKRQNQLLPSDIDETQYSSIANIPKKRFYVDVLAPSLNKSLGDLRRIPPLLKCLPQIVRENDIDIIFHTAPPFYTLPAVSLLSDRLEIPYIFDLRDPWYISKSIFNSSKSVSNPPWSYFNRAMEYISIRKSSKITTATREMKDQYQKEYPEYSDKFVSIPNGYDPDDYDIDYSKSEKEADINLIYPGKFRDNMEGFLQAYHRLNNDVDIRLIHYGNEENELTRKFYNRSRELDLSDTITMRGYADFEEIVKEIYNSDVGLVVTRKDDPTHVPQKTFDYIACDTPILALGPKGGELDQILKPFEFAFRTSHENIDEIESILKFFVNNGPKTLGTQKMRQQYTRQSATEQLSGLLNNEIK